MENSITEYFIANVLQRKCEKIHAGLANLGFLSNYIQNMFFLDACKVIYICLSIVNKNIIYICLKGAVVVVITW
jgi:hypothetical protein